jgi:hypothetical protein
MDMECPCRRCRRPFQPTIESLYRGSPHWWYCPDCQSEQEWGELRRTLRTQLTIALGRSRLLHRRLRQEREPERVAADVEALERALAELRTAVERLDETPLLQGVGRPRENRRDYLQ